MTFAANRPPAALKLKLNGRITPDNLAKAVAEAMAEASSSPSAVQMAAAVSSQEDSMPRISTT